MRNLAALAMIASVVGSGCYLGSTPRAKRGAYVINSIGAVIGTSLLVTTPSSAHCATDETFGDCLDDAIRYEQRRSVGQALLIGAIVGTFATMAVQTTPEPPPRPEDRYQYRWRRADGSFTSR